MVTVLALLGVLAVLFAAAVLATRDDPLLADAPADAADVPLPDDPLQPEDVRGLRFSLAVRGYRMAEVDLALDRLAVELADRDRRIALLEAAAQGHEERASEVREAGVEDLPAAADPVPAVAAEAAPDAAEQAPAPAGVAAPVAWSNPAAVPEFPVIAAPEAAAELPPAPDWSIAEVPREPAPLPPADLGSELLTQERVDEALAAAAPAEHDAPPTGDQPEPTAAGDDAPPAGDGDAPPVGDGDAPRLDESASPAAGPSVEVPPSTSGDDPPHHGSAAATGAVSGDDLTAALEETGDRPHH